MASMDLAGINRVWVQLPLYDKINRFKGKEEQYTLFTLPLAGLWLLSMLGTAVRVYGQLDE